MSAAKYDVLVVGAGASGLTAGLRLACTGRRVAILEARDRVGGRIWTRPTETGVPIEMGAEFIHGLPAVTWDLVKRAALATYEINGSQLRFARGTLADGSAEQSGSRQVLESMSDWVDAHDRDMSFADYLQISGTGVSAGRSAADYVEGFNAADRCRIGIAALARQQRAEDSIQADRIFRVERGYGAVPQFLSEQALSAGAELFLGSRVHKVAWTPGSVTIDVRDPTDNQRQLQADKAVITVPLGVLQAGSIHFTPQPGEFLLQADRLAMGSVVRVTLLFSSRFWTDPRSSRPELARALADMSFLFTPAELPATWWTAMPRAIPTLTAWVGGPRARTLERAASPDGNPIALRDRCLATLAKVFDIPMATLKTLLVSWHSHDWDADEYARGAYSYVPDGALDASERMSRPVRNTLFFAGEHTDTAGHWGTVHAALATGERAARQVIDSSADFP